MARRSITRELLTYMMWSYTILYFHYIYDSHPVILSILYLCDEAYKNWISSSTSETKQQSRVLLRLEQTVGA